MTGSEQTSVSPRIELGFYAKYIKRFLDIVCALSAIVVFCWLYAIIAVLVRIKMGSPVIFKQPRPGKIDKNTGRERVFNMYKFRTMSDARDKDGNLLPDSERLTKLGSILRATSLDELPEAFNILKGDMSAEHRGNASHSRCTARALPPRPWRKSAHPPAPTPSSAPAFPSVPPPNPISAPSPATYK